MRGRSIRSFKWLALLIDDSAEARRVDLGGATTAAANRGCPQLVDRIRRQVLSRRPNLME
jgi:hypothetical protein